MSHLPCRKDFFKHIEITLYSLRLWILFLLQNTFLYFLSHRKGSPLEKKASTPLVKVSPSATGHGDNCLAFSLIHSILWFSLVAIVCNSLMWDLLIQRLRLKQFFSGGNLNNVIPFLCILGGCSGPSPDRLLCMCVCVGGAYFPLWNSWLLVSFIVN